MGFDGSTAVLSHTGLELSGNLSEQAEHDLRLALLTTASMIGLLRNQLDQVTMTLPHKQEDKFHAIFRSKLTNVSADLLEFQSLLPVAEQMLCCPSLETLHSQAQQVTADYSPIAHTVELQLNTDAERMNLFLGSKETDLPCNHDTPPPSVVWADEWASQSDKRDREEIPHLPINLLQEHTVSRARSKESAEQQTKKEAANGKKKALIKFIYTLMKEKGLTDPNGHLLMDVYVEIWNEVVGEKGCGGRAGFHRFAEMLRGAPEYFEVFHVESRSTRAVDPSLASSGRRWCDWCSRLTPRMRG